MQIRDILAGVGLLALAVVGGYSLRPAHADGIATSQGTSLQQTRACAFPTGGWTTVDCSAAAAYSAQLTANTRYVVQCTADAYWVQTSAGSSQDADSNDGYAPAGAWFEFSTVNGNRYYSCDGSATAGKCRHYECQ